MVHGQEIALRAIGTALAGLSGAFAVYMLAYGEGKTRVNGMEYLMIFAQPRGSPAAPIRVQPPPQSPRRLAPPLDIMTTGSVPPSTGKSQPDAGPAEIIAARADRVWLRIGGQIRAVAPGDNVPGLGRVGAIVSRGGGWALLDDKGATMLSVAKDANGASLFARKMIFE